MKRLILIAIAMLAGCVTLSPKADQSNLFVLTPTTRPQSGTSVPVVVGVAPVVLPDYLDRSQIVTRHGQNRITLAELDRWGEPLRDGFARTLRVDLAAQLGGAPVAGPARRGLRDAELVVAVDVLRFERVSDSSGSAVELFARWSLRDPRSGASLVDRESHIVLPVADGGASSAVASLSRAVDAMSQEIAEGVRGVAARVAHQR